MDDEDNLQFGYSPEDRPGAESQSPAVRTAMNSLEGVYSATSRSRVVEAGDHPGLACPAEVIPNSASVYI